MMQVRTALTEQELNDVYQIRKEVFIQEQGVPADIEVDDKESESVHFILYNEKIPAGAGRLRFQEETAKAERVCVVKESRGTGMGRVLMKEMEKYAIKAGASRMKLNAQLHAAVFYTQIGYETVSAEPFLDAGIEHVTMEKRLS